MRKDMPMSGPLVGLESLLAECPFCSNGDPETAMLKFMPLKKEICMHRI